MRRPRNADVILGSHVLVNRERTIVGHSLTRELLAACCSLFARTFGFGFHYNGELHGLTLPTRTVNSGKGSLSKMKWKTRGGLMGTASGGQSLRHRYATSYACVKGI